MSYTVNGSLKLAFRYIKRRVLKRQKEDPDWPFPHIPENLTLQNLRPNAVSRDRDTGITAEESTEIRDHDVKVSREFNGYPIEEDETFTATSNARYFGVWIYASCAWGATICQDSDNTGPGYPAILTVDAITWSY